MYEYWTKCTSPSSWSPLASSTAITAAGVFGVVALLAGAITTGFGAALAGIILSIAGGASGLWAILTVFDWLLGGKLVCLQEGAGDYKLAFGTVTVIEPPLDDITSFENVDNDYSWNILLAPYELYTSWANLSTAAAENSVTVPFSLPTFNNPGYALDYLAQETQDVKNLASQFGVASVTFTGQEGSVDYPVLHCEIEGSRVYHMKGALLAILTLTTIASIAIPASVAALGAVPFLGWLLFLLYLIVAGVVYLATWYGSSDPTPGSGGFSGNPDPPANGFLSVRDIVLVYGKWVYDAGHSPTAGSNEIHPVLLLQKLPAMPPLSSIAVWEGLIQDGTSPQTVINQADSENNWALNPSVDGCENPNQPPPPLK